MNIHRLTIITIVCCLCTTSILFAQQAERTLNLKDSISTGLNNSQDLLVLQERVALAKQRINEARAHIYPKIDFGMSVAQFNNNTPAVLPPSFSSLYLPSDNKDLYYSTRFTLWQYLYAGGRYKTNLKVADANISHAQSQVDVIRNEIIKNVKKKFYSFLTVSKKLEAYNKALKEMGALKNKQPKRKDYWDSYITKIKAELESLNHEYKKTRLRFLDAVGLELNTTIQLEGEMKIPGQEYDLNKCLAWGFQYRAELRQTQFREKIDSLRVNLSITERYPTITLGANYEWIGDQFPLPDKNWSAIINLNVPIFDGWAAWSRIKQRKLKMREGKILRAEIEDKIRLEIRYAYLDYNYWYKKVLALKRPDIEGMLPDEKLDNTILWLDNLKELLHSHATLEWATGKPLNEIK